jgi:ABC-2 type transport system permease protein
MVVSVWARRNAFLWAVLPPVAILTIENMILGSNRFGDFLGHRFVGVFQLLEHKVGSVHGSGMITVRQVLDAVSGVLSSQDTWLGVLVAAAMVFGAIRIRRYRDDS